MKKEDSEFITEERLIAYFRQELEGAEREEIETWLAASEEHRKAYRQICQVILWSRWSRKEQLIDEAAALGRLRQRRSQPSLRWWRYAAAVAVLIVALAGGWLWKQGNEQPLPEIAQVVPGSAKAVLTLAGGQQVKLTGQTQQEIQVAAGIKVKQEVGTLAYEAKTGENAGRQEYNTLSTGRGGEYRLVLADGTKVFLNAATTLKYPVAFNGEIRKVELEGEAYFEVTKDSGHPFVVETKGMEVKVYGTSFNINTLRMDEVQTVLVEGSIGIRSVATDQEYRVHPGQMAVWNKTDGSMKLKEVDVSLYTAWKEGIFRFNRERLEDILNTLSNWYDVEIFYQNSDIRDLHFSGYMERYDQIETILEAITVATDVRFVIQGKTIIVSK